MRPLLWWHFPALSVVSLGALASLQVACSSSGSSSSSPTGGGGASGGSSTGGAPSGGASQTGGSSGAGGTPSGAGGALSSGGVTASGGSSGASGAGGGTDGGSVACAAPAASAPAVVLADFESGTIPTSDTASRGFRGSDVARGTILTPGANGTAKAAEFSFATDNSLFYQSNNRPEYLNGSSTYDPALANALEFYMRIPAGSSLLSASGASTFSVYTYHYKPGDPWVGTNTSGGNLTDSQMHGYGPMRFDPSAADRWMHVVMSSSAFDHSRGNYHFYAARAVAEDLTFFGSLRQFQPVFLSDRSSGPVTVDYDEFRLVTLPPTASICPPGAAATVSASGGDYTVPLTITNPTATARSYRLFVSSTIGLDRQTIEIATHDADDVSAVDNLQGAVGSDGGLGAVEAFADDGTGKPTGANLVTAGKDLAITAGGSLRVVLVHHVTAAMLGPAQAVPNAGFNYNLRRDTLMTSVIVWDPAAPRVGDTAAVFTGSNADTSHPAPPGFPTYVDPPAGWHSTDVPPDQAAGYFVSVLKLTP